MLRAARQSAIPGFKVTLGVTLMFLSCIVLIPLSTLVLKTAGMDGAQFLKVVSSDRALAAYRTTFGCSFAAALTNVVFGLIIAWILVRYRFPGKRLLDAMVDLPFALPTAVAGIALATIYAPNGWVGQYLAPLGINVAFTPLGIYVALVFVGLPFVVRTVQPVLQDFEVEVEDAAASLGASRMQTFIRVLFPQLFPSVMTGFMMAFARALGEYGSVIFVGGNLPKVSEIVPLLIVIKLEQYDYVGATALAAVMLVASFLLFFVINSLQSKVKGRGV